MILELLNYFLIAIKSIICRLMMTVSVTATCNERATWNILCVNMHFNLIPTFQRGKHCFQRVVGLLWVLPDRDIWSAAQHPGQPARAGQAGSLGSQRAPPGWPGSSGEDRPWPPVQRTQRQSLYRAAQEPGHVHSGEERRQVGEIILISLFRPQQRAQMTFCYAFSWIVDLWEG